MKQALRAFFRRMDAQDLVEYTLLLAFIALVGISIIIGASGSVQGIWGSANTSLIAANTSAAGGAVAAPTTGGSGGSGGSGGDGDGHGDHGDGDHGH